MSSDFPFSTARSSLLNTETFRNLLGNALENSTKSVIILSAYVKTVGVNWLKEKISDNHRIFYQFIGMLQSDLVLQQFRCITILILLEYEEY